ncbi:putative 2-aminoethylphosphonate ABC transporter ATP-binding protein [Shimia sp. CNT1-13L.2]|uniref:putative 2-aminoethylphosphonate ABC transporter ATP-binding protein n=1 Tax=Shimia sp. CNT1-13L.2 TaxID=2959663 RepID=UPI0020CD3F41|nr:putative 2-aminoethylphosphonate ABC transporter ATP-binding protein [Shimia sp. CNT1-13L.2]MCP9483228.1 putative 2-aminoethylphosphonate ABC transporter ATP-binding protein [Shimia sp. CNT1-13L.2]
MAFDETFLDIEALGKTFDGFAALSEVSLSVREGEFVCFVGPSGCGKTTLLRAIAGLDRQSSGRILRKGQDISDVPPAARDCGIVFQSYALFPNLTVSQNIAYGLPTGRKHRAVNAARVEEMLALIGMQAHSGKYPAQLSGGQQQRVALARAMARGPGLLLLDEPLSALDAKVRVQLRDEIKGLQRRLGVTTIMVTHDQEEALAMADRIVVMNAGQVEQVGTPAEVYGAPKSLFVAEFIGEMNRWEGVASGGTLEIGQEHVACAGEGEVVAAIRPEDVVIGQGQIRAKVSEMEFLGAFWRCRFAARGMEIVADVPAQGISGIAVGDAVQVDLPEHRLHLFGGASA